MPTAAWPRVGSEIDCSTPWRRHVLSFIKIAEVEIVAADAMGCGPERPAQAKQRIRLLAAA
jgi:FMN-dependent NADH-azoreductase